jgi:hypothetical protein
MDIAGWWLDARCNTVIATARPTEKRFVSGGQGELRGSKHRYDDGKNQQIGYSPVKIDSPLCTDSRRALLYILDAVDLKDVFLPDKARRATIDHGKTDGIGNREDDRRRSRLARTGREYHLAQSGTHPFEHRARAGADRGRSILKRDAEEEASGLRIHRAGDESLDTSQLGRQVRICHEYSERPPEAVR